MQTFTFEDLNSSELTDITMEIPEDPIEFRASELADGVHGSARDKIPVYVFSFAALISVLVWLDRQEGRTNLDLKVESAGSAMVLSISKDEARDALDRVRELPPRDHADKPGQ